MENNYYKKYLKYKIKYNSLLKQYGGTILGHYVYTSGSVLIGRVIDIQGEDVYVDSNNGRRLEKINIRDIQNKDFYIVRKSRLPSDVPKSVSKDLPWQTEHFHIYDKDTNEYLGIIGGEVDDNTYFTDEGVYLEKELLDKRFYIGKAPKPGGAPAETKGVPVETKGGPAEKKRGSRGSGKPKINFQKRIGLYKDDFMDPRKMHEDTGKDGVLVSVAQVPCEVVKGIKQTHSTCWFDSTFMGLVFPSDLRQLWGPFLYAKYGFNLFELNTDIKKRNGILSVLTPFIKDFIKPGGKTGPLANELTRNGFFQYKLLKFWIYSFNDIANKKWTDSDNFNVHTLQLTFKNLYSNKQIGSFTEILFTNNEILVDRINILGEIFIKINLNKRLIYQEIGTDTSTYNLSSTSGFEQNRCFSFFVRNIGLSCLPQLELLISGQKYYLKTILLGGYGHAITITLCDDGKWYIYDNEDSKIDSVIRPLRYSVMNIDGIDYLYQTGYIDLNSNNVSLNKCSHLVYIYYK